ncbi:MAG: AraC family transcriptional regulator [Chloroflexi bacterium]|nr:MAG: AraC family transcriptional regulator [Chloroflexota bacterium]
MEPRIESKHAFTVAGKLYHGNNENQEVAQLWGGAGSWMEQIQAIAEPEAAYGVMGNIDMDSGVFDYLAGLAVVEDAPTPEGLDRWSIPAQTYAVFTCTLPTLMQAFHSAYETWLPQSGYRRAGGPEFELYGPAFDPNDPGSQMEIWIPVQAG